MTTGSDYFEAALSGTNPKQAANWMPRYRCLPQHQKLSITTIALKPAILAELLTLIEEHSGKIAKDILPELLTEGGLPRTGWRKADSNL